MTKSKVRTLLPLALMLVMVFGVSDVASAHYDNTSPYHHDCAYSASTPRNAAIYHPSGFYQGWVELRYSSTCRTVWGRAISTQTHACQPGVDYCVFTKAHRNSDGYEVPIVQSASGSKQVYSNQLDDAGVTSKAYGSIDNGCCSGSAWTGSY